MRRALLAAAVLSGSACHNDWQQVLDECVAAGRCSNAGGGSGGASGGNVAGGAGGGTAGGSGVGVRLSLDPDAGRVMMTLEPGQHATLDFTLTNSGDSLSEPISFLMSGDSGVFSVTTGPPFPCGNALQRHDHCNLTVSFAPTMSGDFHDVLTASENVAGGATASAPVSGHVVAVPVPLTVNVAGDGGAGQVLVHQSPFADVHCPAECSAPLTYSRGSIVSLTALPNRADFAWDAGCTGAGLDASCDLLLASDAGDTVGAGFFPWPSLTVSALPANMRSGDVQLTLDGGGLDCGDPQGCTVGVKAGTPFQVFALATGFARPASWVGCGSTPGGTCVGLMPADGGRVTAMYDAFNRAYLSPTAVALTSGLPVYDSLCTGFSGVPDDGTTHFVAWLSTGGVTAQSRLGSARGWVRLDGKPFVDVPLSADHASFYPLVIDSNLLDAAADAGPLDVATGAGGLDCNQWTFGSGMVGTGRATAAGWLFDDTGVRMRTCGESLRIMCLQADHTSPLSAGAVPDGGRLAFVTSALVPGATSTLAANTRCQMEWTGGGGRQFVALRTQDDGGLATNGLPTDAGTWYRRDGVRLLPAASALLQPGPLRLEAPLYQQGDGAYVSSSTASAWTGAPGASCAGWADGGAMGLSGDVLDSAATWWSGSTVSCAQALRLYCFER